MVNFDGEFVSKPINEWNDNMNTFYNAKAMNTFFFAFNNMEFTRVKNCKTTFEIWKLLEVTHKKTSQVKDSRLSNLTPH
jgi:hypothetical protein